MLVTAAGRETTERNARPDHLNMRTPSRENRSPVVTRARYRVGGCTQPRGRIDLAKKEERRHFRFERGDCTIRPRVFLRPRGDAGRERR